MKRETNQKKSAGMKSKWGDPAYRKMMIEKQKAIGFRSYGSKFTYRPLKGTKLKKSSKWNVETAYSGLI
jgi:hypothetical protein